MSTMSRSSAGDVPGPKDSWLSIGWVFEVVPSLKLTARTWKWWFPIGISFSRGLFSGAMLVLGRVVSKKFCFHPEQNGESFPFWRLLFFQMGWFNHQLMFVASRWETRLENNTCYTFMKKLVVGLKVDATTSNKNLIKVYIIHMYMMYIMYIYYIIYIYIFIYWLGKDTLKVDSHPNLHFLPLRGSCSKRLGPDASAKYPWPDDFAMSPDIFFHLFPTCLFTITRQPVHCATLVSLCFPIFV